MNLCFVSWSRKDMRVYRLYVNIINICCKSYKQRSCIYCVFFFKGTLPEMILKRWFRWSQPILSALSSSCYTEIHVLFLFPIDILHVLLSLCHIRHLVSLFKCFALFVPCATWSVCSDFLLSLCHLCHLVSSSTFLSVLMPHVPLCQFVQISFLSRSPSN